MNNALAHLTQRIANLENRLQNILQIAKVMEVDAATNLLTIEIRGVPLTSVPYLTMRAGTIGKTYWVPEVDELGVLLSPGGDVGNAIFLPALNYSTAPAPEMDVNIVSRIFADTVKEDWNGNDESHLLSIGGDATRQTDKDPAKIEDTAHDSKLTLEEGTAKLEASSSAKLEIQQSGSAELAASGATKLSLQATPGMAELSATGMSKLILNAIAGNLMGAQLFPSGITTFMSPVGPCLFAPVLTPPTAPPSPPAGSNPDADGNVTQTPPSTITGVAQQAGTFMFTLPPILVTGTAGPNPVVAQTTATPLTLSITGSGITLQFPSQSL